jgi:ABC-2 type transport system ATP-binding protein
MMTNTRSTTGGESEGARAAESPAIVVRGLTKIFKDLWGRPKARAIEGVDFEVRRGEVFGLLGPNGSGKSTTIKILLGLLYPTSGRVEVLGRAPRDVETKRRIGYLPEESHLYRYLTAAETLNFYGHVFALGPEARRVRTEQLLEMVGLAGTGRRVVGEFSKGMQRRLGLAQALLNDPELIILDEPTAGLDPLGCREVKDVIRELAARGKTVLLTSHLLADVEDVCERVVVYYGGKIQASGTLRELLAKPDSLRFTTPALSRPLVEEILQLMKREAAEGSVKLEVPEQNLESYFIDVIRRARGSSLATSGATSGAVVAGYLKAETKLGAPEAGVLERLVETPRAAGSEVAGTPATPPKPEAAEAAVADTAEATRATDAKLASLLNPPSH